MLFSWGVSVCPSGTGLGDVHFLRHVFVLDKFCQHLWGVVHVGGVCFLDMCLYWIYSANNCGVLFTWGVSVCPSGTGLGHVQQKGPHNCLFWWPEKCLDDDYWTTKLHFLVTGQVPGGQVPGYMPGQTSARQTSARPDNCQGGQLPDQTTAREDKCQAMVLVLLALVKG